jgi:hypothetical protein
MNREDTKGAKKNKLILLAILAVKFKPLALRLGS